MSDVPISYCRVSPGSISGTLALALGLVVGLHSCGSGVAAGQPQPSAPAPTLRLAPADRIKQATALPPQEARRLGVGGFVPDATALGLRGDKTSWRSVRGQRLTVIVMTSPSCPLCQKWVPALSTLRSQFASQGVGFIFVDVGGDETAEKTQAHALTLGGTYLRDPEHSLTEALRAKTTTEVFVIDSANTLMYRGAVSDQFGLGTTLDTPRHSFLKTALDELLLGKHPAVNATSSPGCLIEPPAAGRPSPGPTDPAASDTTRRAEAAANPAPAARPVTYTKDIARIVQNNCLQCHRAGGVAPFALDSYEAVAKRAAMIQSVTQEGLMPPWFAAPLEADQVSPWANDRSLTIDEKDTIAAWIRAGKPRGEPSDAPTPPTFPSTAWSIGQPDVTYQLPNPISIKADGVMPYQMVRIPTGLAEDKWVTGVQILPTDRSVVHHVLVFAIPTLDARGGRLAAARDAIDESRGFFAAYVPGNDSVVYPAGFAKLLPKGSTLLFQIHYTPNGKATTDQMQIGLIFAAEPPEHIVRTAGIVNRRLNIPPNAANHTETASVTVPSDAKLLSFMPHMHVRGKAFRYQLQSAGDTSRTVLDIPRYDFNWQLRYVLQHPLDVAAGSTILATAWYDNSAANPANPDPSKRVRWGPQTYDEMMLGYIEYYLVREDPAHPDELPDGGRSGHDPAIGASKAGVFDRLLKLYDKNRDGNLQRAEVPNALHTLFDRLDSDKDGVVTREEFER